MTTSQIPQSETPIFDEINAAKRMFPDLLPPDDVEPVSTEQKLADQALADIKPVEPKLISVNGFSKLTSDLIRRVNDAILDSQTTIDGQSLGDFMTAQATHGYIPTHEIEKVKLIAKRFS